MLLPDQPSPADRGGALDGGLRVETLLTIPFTGRGVSYACGQVLRAMGADGAPPSLFTLFVAASRPPVPFRQALPAPVGRLSYRLAPAATRRLAEVAFLRRLRGGPAVAYLWSDTSPPFARDLQRAGAFVVREKVNCGKALAKRVLDDAYRRLGLSPAHGITDAQVAEERDRLERTHAVFCPSPLVEESLRELGLPALELLPTSYGFDPERLATSDRLLEPVDGPTFVFVGTICVRKGAHLLLRAWARSGVKGRLVLAGALEGAIAEVCAAELARPDVLRLSFVENVAALYNSADAFVFPTLEEGNPLVVNEAAHRGLPLVVSPMGAGRQVRDGEEGVVLDPYDEDGWVDALRLLASQPGLRERMGEAARARAREFTWARVGARRREILADAVAGRTPGAP